MRAPSLDSMTKDFNDHYNGHHVYQEQALKTYQTFLKALELLGTEDQKKRGFELLEAVTKDALNLRNKYPLMGVMNRFFDTIDATYRNVESQGYKKALALGFTPQRSFTSLLFDSPRAGY
ncbi:MAG: hypothetical protein LRY76_04465 [Alphaproteobacteria bacterium]|nr:hypothetical protein [Alphaproteobacteria bacterium]MCD8570772.1 hypothetical protein [Alphaproteobacteria bacterium]